MLNHSIPIDQWSRGLKMGVLEMEMLVYVLFWEIRLYIWRVTSFLRTEFGKTHLGRHTLIHPCSIHLLTPDPTRVFNNFRPIFISFSNHLTLTNLIPLHSPCILIRIKKFVRTNILWISSIPCYFYPIPSWTACLICRPHMYLFIKFVYTILSI